MNGRACTDCGKRVWVTPGARIASHGNQQGEPCTANGASVFPGKRDQEVDRGIVDAIIESDDWTFAKRLDPATKRELIRRSPVSVPSTEMGQRVGVGHEWVLKIRSLAAAEL